MVTGVHVASNMYLCVVLTSSPTCLAPTGQEGISPVKLDETPETLWGAEKPDPREAFKANGFQMRRVVLTRPPLEARFEKADGAARKETLH